MKIDWPVFTFPFDEPDWFNKFAIGAGLALASALLGPLLLWLYLPLAGYMVRVLRKSAGGAAPSLPEWDNWGELFMDGLRATLIAVVYLLPVILLYMCVTVLWIGAPFMLALTTDRSASQVSFAPMMGLYGISIFLFALVYVMGLPLGFLALVGISRMAVLGSVSKGFEFTEVWALTRRGFRHFILAYVLYLGVSFVAMTVAQMSAATIILCCITPFLEAAAIFYILTEAGTLFGMAYHATENPPTTVEGVFKDTDPLIKTDPLLKKAEAPAGGVEASAGVVSPAAPAAGSEKDDASTDEVPVVTQENIAGAAVVKDEAATDEVPAAKPEAAKKPRKPRASTPRKKKSGDGEGTA